MYAYIPTLKVTVTVSAPLLGSLMAICRTSFHWPKNTGYLYHVMKPFQLTLYYLIWCTSSISHATIHGLAFAFMLEAKVPSRMMHNDRQHTYTPSSIFQRWAIVYGPDGSRMDSDDMYNTDDIGSKQDWNNDKTSESSVLEAFQVQVDPRQVLRVACAVAPPPYNQIHPSQVTSINLISATLNKIDVGLGISQEGGTTIQILVPIAFQSCQTIQDMVDQLQTTMDTEAMVKIRELEQRTQVVTPTILTQLSEDPIADDLPEWWTWVELQISLREECMNLKQLLNEDDFLDDIRKLATMYHYGDSSSNENPMIEARVAEVGPSGLYLRGLVDESPTVSTKPSSSPKIRIIPVAIRFDTKATTPEMLRNNVLKLIDPLEEVKDPEIIETMTTTTTKPSEETLPSADPVQEPLSIVQIRKQPKSFEEEELLAAKYAAIPDLGDRAYTILKDLRMI